MNSVEQKFRNLEIEVELERLKEEMRRGKTGDYRTKTQTNEGHNSFRNDKIVDITKSFVFKLLPR